jgi:predicted deacetylase
MGYIKEPSGIDFVVDPTPMTAKDRKKISEIIAFYKATGRKMTLLKSNPVHSHKTETRSDRRSRKRVSS